MIFQNFLKEIFLHTLKHLILTIETMDGVWKWGLFFLGAEFDHLNWMRKFQSNCEIYLNWKTVMLVRSGFVC